MTRKDYVLIAEAFKQEAEQYFDRGEESAEKAAIRLTAQRMARMLESDNARFDRARFLRACGF